jgi:sec-independent protein translocase protein TatA
MLGDLFDSPWKILIIAVVVLVLFGSRKLPEAARSLGRSMRILKTEIHELHEEGANGAQPAQAAAQPQPQPVPPQQLAAPAAGVPVMPVTTADGVPMAAPVAPAAAPVPPAAPVAPPASVPVPEVQQDTRPV